MGNACCGSDESAQRDKALDQYIKTHHINKYPHKCSKFSKTDLLMSVKQDFDDDSKCYKAQIVNEILDENARKQDMQTPESIDQSLLSDLSTLTNSLTGGADGAKGRERGGTVDPSDNGVFAMKEVREDASLMLGGENGTGGRPLKKKPDNPYLEIDLIDPSDPILFEGEIQKYKPGFKACFIDRWVQVTQKAFRYFVSKPSADNPVIKPLLAIPIIGIQRVCTVNHELPIKKKDLTSQQLAKNQFEIFLKDDFVNYYLSSLYEKHFSPDGKRINTGIKFLEKMDQKKKKFSPSKKMQVLDLKEKYLKEEENQLEEPLTHAAMESLNTHQGAWTNREEMWILTDRRLLFATKSVTASGEWVEVIDQLVNEKAYNLSN